MLVDSGRSLLGRTGDSVSRVDDDSGQVALRVAVRPTRSESEHSLDSDVETLEMQQTVAIRVRPVPRTRRRGGIRTWTLNDSNMISAVFSLFSGGLRGGSVC